MPRKKSMPTIVKVHAKARSVRSMAVGWCTLFFDAEFESTMRDAKFNPFVVARLKKPKKAFDTLCQWSKQGAWCAVESHPEIADADGVPGLDLIIGQDHQMPEEEGWFFSGTQVLSLPSGQLKIAYEQEFFEEWYGDEFPVCDFSDPKTESFENEEFVNATNYLLNVEPGTYALHIYTLDYSKKNGDGRRADLVVYLNRSSSKKNGKARPLIGYSGK